jgi:ABC-type nitrate/sulfonate/bicarbonate transport system permease component
MRAPLKRLNLVGWAVFALVVLLVETWVRVLDLHDSVAAPSATLQALIDEVLSGVLAREIGTTLESYAWGLGAAITVGVSAGLVLGSSRVLLDASSVVLEVLRPIPAVAIIPIVVFYAGLDTARYAVAFGAVWPILVHTIYGVRAGDSLLHDVARTSGSSRVGRFARVTVPAALPSIATGVRVSASLALLVCVTAEWVVRSGGLGSYMEQQQSATQLPEMYAAIVVVGLLGYLVNVGLRTAERSVVFWVGEEQVAR